MPRPPARPAGRRRIHAAVIAAASVPALALAWRAAADALGANPIEEITHQTGRTALRLLLACLAITPLRRLFGWNALAPYRRTLGLLAFGYACLHVATYAALDLGFDWAAIAEDVAERPYVSAGFAAFACLLPLALTSTRASIRLLGPKRWTALHRLVYLAALAAVVHFLWLVKADLREPLGYAAVLALLLGARAAHFIGLRRPAAARAAPPPAPGRAARSRPRADRGPSR
jgi:sulfoxide reductase heme-binding subunit YedZ